MYTFLFLIQLKLTIIYLLISTLLDLHLELFSVLYVRTNHKLILLVIFQNITRSYNFNRHINHQGS